MVDFFLIMLTHYALCCSATDCACLHAGHGLACSTKSLIVLCWMEGKMHIQCQLKVFEHLEFLMLYDSYNFQLLLSQIQKSKLKGVTREAALWKGERDKDNYLVH